MPSGKNTAPRGKPGSELSRIPLRGDVRWRPKFLDQLLETEGNVTEAALRTGISTRIAYQVRNDDADFAQDWADVMQIIDQIRADKIEEATADRAVHGSRYSKYNAKGALIEEGTVPDTTAAVTMLKAIRPERFREKDAPPDPTGRVIQSFTDLVRALGEERRARAALQQASLPPMTTGPTVDVKALGPAPPLIREVN
jgi:hypothetical protein